MNTYLTSYTTQHLSIRPLEKEDAEVWKEFLLNEAATRYFTEETKMNPEFAPKWIEGQLTRYAENRFGMMALLDKENGDFIGQAGLLSQTVNDVEELEVGYHLLPKYWGQGYATEAAVFFKELGFNKFEAESIISLIHEDNTPSQKVAERNGMSRTVPTTHYDLPCYVYRITKEEYLQANIKP